MLRLIKEKETRRSHLVGFGSDQAGSNLLYVLPIGVQVKSVLCEVMGVQSPVLHCLGRALVVAGKYEMFNVEEDCEDYDQGDENDGDGQHDGNSLNRGAGLRGIVYLHPILSQKERKTTKIRCFGRNILYFRLFKVFLECFWRVRAARRRRPQPNAKQGFFCRNSVCNHSRQPPGEIDFSY